MRNLFFRHISKLVILLVLLSVMQIVSPQDTAWAEEWVYKFKVPVELKNIPDVPEMKLINVYIILFDKDGKEMTTVKKHHVPIGSDGKLSEIVEVYVYESDIPKAKEVLHKVMSDHELVLDDPQSNVAVSELADSSVNLVVRPWCKAIDYWQVYFDITEAAKVNLEANNITIPFPQRDVHLFQS